MGERSVLSRLHLLSLGRSSTWNCGSLESGEEARVCLFSCREYKYLWFV
jgi:hypothetical protein